MRQLIVGNWKMNGLSAEAARLAQGVRDGVRDGAAGVAAELLVCPPFTQVAAVAGLLAGSHVSVGGQDCHARAPGGAFTGDVSAAMLRDCGASWVILGHSERRAGHHETDEAVREKVLAAQGQGLTPIVCVGETDEQRQGGRETEAVGWQISGSLPEGFAGVLAYEPVWAIGSGRTCALSDVAMMHAFIREELTRQFGAERGAAVRILYGGSVKPDNAAGVLAQRDVGGVLVGGASLDAAAFLAIAAAAVAAEFGGG